MRKFFLALAAFSALLAVSCQVEKLPTEENALVITSFSAAMEGDEAETRTFRHSNLKVYWKPADQLSVFIAAGADGGACFTSTNTTAKSRVEFVGDLTRPSVSTYYYAYYPYSTSVSFDGSAFQATLPDEQQAADNTFADDLFISMGRTRTSSMLFYHLTGGIKFTLTQDGIRSVTLRGLKTETVAGEFVADLGGDYENPTVRKVVNGSDAVTLAAQSDALVPGTAYHIVTLPVNFQDGFQLIFEKTDGSIAAKTIAKPLDIQRAHFAVLNEVDKGLRFEKNYFDLDPLDIALPSYSQEFKVHVRSSEEPHVDLYDDWISLLRVEGDVRAGADYVFRVARNESEEEREGYVSVCANNLCKMVTVVQAGHVEGDWMGSDFVHHSFGMRFTRTTCGYCPMMSEAFRMVNEQVGDKFLYACFYSAASGGDYSYSGNPILEDQYNVTGHPTGIVDGRVDIPNYSVVTYTVEAILDAIAETEATYPTVTALDLNSALNGNTATVDVNVYCKATDSYKLTVLLLENGIVGYQTDYNEGNHNDFVHNKVVRAALTSITGDAFTAGAGEEKSFKFSCTIPNGYVKDNLEIVAYVQRPFGSQTVIQSGDYGDYYVDNSRAAALGTFADIELK